MKKRKVWSIGAAALLLAATAFTYMLAGCQQTVVPPGGEETDDWYIEVDVSPPVTPKLITVNEYKVTGLLISVTDPEEQEIQVINWSASEGPRRYRIPVTMEGPHEVTVTHVSQEGQQTVQASESATFNIQAMIITEVTVVPGAIGFINIAAPEQQAINVARMDVLPRVIEETEATRYSLLRMDTAVPAGTSIFEDIQSDDQIQPAEFTTEKDGYLFLLDLEPGAFYEHPVKYVFVSEDGDTTELDANWWPVVGDEVPTPFVRDTPLLKHVVERNVSLVKPQISTIDWQIRPGLIQVMETEAFICVQGLTPTESLYTCAVNTFNNGYNFFTTYMSSTGAIVGLTDYNANNVLTEINTLANNGYDIITIYIIAHGGVDSVRLGGVHLYASQFAATMAAHPGVEFNFLLGSCHSGSFINNLSPLENVRVVKTACGTSESAYGDVDDSDYNTSDTGSEWTSSILKAADIIVANSSLWSAVTSIAAADGVPKTSAMLRAAGYLGVGDVDLGTMFLNYDVTYRFGWCTPRHYESW